MKRVLSPAAAWLAQNDPTYVAPTVKAARTREMSVLPEALAAMCGGTGLRKVGGRYTQCLSVGFEGGSEKQSGQVVPIQDATQESTLDQTRNLETYGGVRRRGKRGGKQARKGRE